MADKEVALIVGAGEGLSASLARLCAQQGMDIAVAARNPDKLSDLCAETGASAYACDVIDEKSVDAMFDAVVAEKGVPNLVVYNPSARARGPITELDREAVQNRGSDHVLWRVRRCPEGCRADVGTRQRDHPVHWCFGKCEGLSEFLVLRDWQIRTARSRPIHGTGTPAPEYPYRSLRDRWRDREEIWR